MRRTTRFSMATATAAIAASLTMALAGCVNLEPAPTKSEETVQEVEETPAPEEAAPETAPAETEAQGQPEEASLEAAEEGPTEAPYSYHSVTEVAIKSETYPYVKQFKKSDRVREGEATIYYVNDGDIPYVALSDYLPMLSEVLSGIGRGDIEYTVEKSQEMEHLYSVTRTDNDSTLVIDTLDDEISFSDYNTFTMMKNTKALVTLMDMPEPSDLDLEAILDKYEQVTEEEQAELTAELQKNDSFKENGLFQAASKSYNR